MNSADSLQQELLNALTLAESGDGVLRAPYFSEGRGVVFGGQLLGQAIVAASRRIPGKRVKSVQTIFARGLDVTAPETIVVGDVDVNDPEHVGPAALQLWVRFP